MSFFLYVALACVAGLSAAIVGGILGIEVMLRFGAVVFAACLGFLLLLAGVRRFFDSSSDFEADFAGEPVGEDAVYPHAAEEELKRQDRGTILRPK